MVKQVNDVFFADWIWRRPMIRWNGMSLPLGHSIMLWHTHACTDRGRWLGRGQLLGLSSAGRPGRTRAFGTGRGGWFRVIALDWTLLFHSTEEINHWHKHIVFELRQLSVWSVPLPNIHAPVVPKICSYHESTIWTSSYRTREIPARYT